METFLKNQRIELRVDQEGKPKIAGYASVFNEEYRNEFWGMIEVVLPGAFTRTLSEGADVRALIDHIPTRIIGRTKSNTLSLRQDEKGLFSEIIPPDTTHGRDVLESIKRGDLDGMSFGFIIKEERWGTKDKMFYREILDVDLYDVSVVTFPAYKGTSVGLRQMRSDGTNVELNEVLASAKTALQRQNSRWQFELNEKYLAILDATL